MIGVQQNIAQKCLKMSFLLQFTNLDTVDSDFSRDCAKLYVLNATLLRFSAVGCEILVYADAEICWKT